MAKKFKLEKADIRSRLLKAGVKNLRTFGYPHVNEANILTDLVYQTFFKQMLEDDENITSHSDIEEVRLELLQEITNHKEKGQGS